MTALGWAVTDEDGINVKSVADSRRAAIINWLVTTHSLAIMNAHSDADVENMWAHHRGSADVGLVSITVLTKGES